jgi:hypothetical protein
MLRSQQRLVVFRTVFWLGSGQLKGATLSNKTVVVNPRRIRLHWNVARGCCCGGVVWPTCGNPSAHWFRYYFTMPLFYVTAFVCIVNIARSSSFDHEPPSTRPVQGQAPRGSTELLDPSSRKVASGQSSHPTPRIAPYDTAVFTRHFSYYRTLFLSHFCTLRLGTLFQICLPIFVQPLPGSPTLHKNLRTGRSPLPQW